MGFLKKFQDTEKEATVKAFTADGLQTLPPEHKSELQILREENEWLKMVLKDCEKKHVDEKSRRVVDMTRPQPCTKDKCLSALSWSAKLSEEERKVGKEALKLAQIIGTDSDEVKKTEARLAMRLTKIITLCTSWLHYGLSCDEQQRDQMQMRINKKNLYQGSIGDNEALHLQEEEKDVPS
jgi:hypothetical protein